MLSALDQTSSSIAPVFLYLLNSINLQSSFFFRLNLFLLLHLVLVIISLLLLLVLVSLSLVVSLLDNVPGKPLQYKVYSIKFQIETFEKV